MCGTNLSKYRYCSCSIIALGSMLLCTKRTITEFLLQINYLEVSGCKSVSNASYTYVFSLTIMAISSFA